MECCLCGLPDTTNSPIRPRAKRPREEASGPHPLERTRSCHRLQPIEFMATAAQPPVPERSLSFEVATLRAAASAAVAECTGGKGLASVSLPGLQHPSLERTSDSTTQSSIPAGDDLASSAPKRSSEGAELQLSHAQLHEALNACPPHGAKAICGRRPRMEDAYTAVPFLLEVPVPADQISLSELIPSRIATHIRSAGNSPDNSEAGGEGAAAESDQAAQHSIPGSPHHYRQGHQRRQQQGTCAASNGEQQPTVMETLHFFGVFDGHGGAEAALHCAQTLHQRIAEALSAVSSPSAQKQIAESFAASQAEAAASLGAIRQASGICQCPGEKCECGLRYSKSGGSSGTASHRVSSGFPADAKLQPLDNPKPVDSQGDDSEGSESDSFLECLQHDGEAGGPAAAEKTKVSSKSNSTNECSTSSKIESALTNAFTKADEEFGKADNAALVGTTAVVALIGSRQLCVANCGDSRAVLCRNGTAIPLTDDHKAAREDETARVEAAGGQILFWNGVRVMGVLAVSRAIGDHCLRPFVIAQPEITILSRRADDELLLLASDGLWDVLTNQEACSLAKRCLRRARQRGATRQSAARIAATVLTRAAVDRGSRDNVTVVVVDLSVGSDSESLARTPSSMGDGLFDGLGSEGSEFGKSPRVSDAGEGGGGK